MIVLTSHRINIFKDCRDSTISFGTQGSVIAINCNGAIKIIDDEATLAYNTRVSMGIKF